MKYQIEFSKEQLQVVQQALEFTSRFCAGQVTFLAPFIDVQILQNCGSHDRFMQKREVYEHALEVFKLNAFPDLTTNEAFGIGSSKLREEAKICYDIYRPILEHFDKELREKNPDIGYSVYQYPGMTFSKEGKIIIKTIE